jgi:hypothetical protein
VASAHWELPLNIPQEPQFVKQKNSQARGKEDPMGKSLNNFVPSLGSLSSSLGTSVAGDLPRQWIA